jgi:hypothetical protein
MMVEQPLTAGVVRKSVFIVTEEDNTGALLFVGGLYPTTKSPPSHQPLSDWPRELTLPPRSERSVFECVPVILCESLTLRVV